MSKKLFTDEEVVLLSKNKYGGSNRKHNTGRPTTKNLSIEEKYARLEAQNKLVRYDRKESVKNKIELFTHKKYIVIKNMITHLCKIAEVSRSGYYAYLN